MSWTEERVKKLKEYWAEGMSASQIAKQLGGVTRNAVIGKVHRLGLSHRTPVDAQADEPAPMPTQADTDLVDNRGGTTAAEPAPLPEEDPSPPPPAKAPPPAPEARDPSLPRPPGPPTQAEEQARISLAEIEKMARKLDLLELTERTCKWPIGDPAEDGFHFCGLPTALGKPYCSHHIEIAFQPVSSRRDRSRAR